MDDPDVWTTAPMMEYVDATAFSDSDKRPDKLLASECSRCGLHYEETAPRISPWFALCPRCGLFNEPRVRFWTTVR